MASTEPLRMLGAVGSPYSRKLRAVLRYRRIPYEWIHLGSPESRGLPAPRVALLPQLFLPGPTYSPSCRAPAGGSEKAKRPIAAIA